MTVSLVESLAERKGGNFMMKSGIQIAVSVMTKPVAAKNLVAVLQRVVVCQIIQYQAQVTRPTELLLLLSTLPVFWFPISGLRSSEVLTTQMTEPWRLAISIDRKPLRLS
jgi:hypothetical protein